MSSKDLKGAKDALVSSLFSLSKASQDASYAIIEFVNMIGGEKMEASGLNDALAAPIAAAAGAIADVKVLAAAADDAPEPKKRKRVAKVRDPNAPKRPLPAYLVFGNEVKREIRRERETKGEEPLTMSQLNEIVQEKWGQLDEKHRAALDDDHSKAVAKYNKLREAYESKPGDAEPVAEAAETAEPAEEEEEEPAPEKRAKPEADKKKKGDGEKKRRKRKDKDLPSSP